MPGPLKGEVTLLVYHEQLLLRVTPVSGNLLQVGRTTKNDIPLDDVKVSRHHARITREDGELFVEDLKSSNGTYVNGHRIKKIKVGHGDQIEVGPFRLQVVVRDLVTAPLPVGLAGSNPTVVPTGAADPLTILVGALEMLDVQAGREPLLRAVLAALMATVGGERAFLYRWDAKRQRTHRVFVHVLEGADAELPTSDTLLMQAVKQRKPCLVTAPLTEEGATAHSVERLAAGNVQSVVVAPLERPGRLIGALYLDSRAGRRVFSSADLEVLERTAHYLAGVLDSVESHEDLKEENARLKALARRAGGPEELPLERLHAPGSPMEGVIKLLKKAAPMDVSVLITGETGTGKEECARLVHRLSEQSAGPLIAVNCGAIPESLVESELFGHNKGAFSGADDDRPGLVELAHGGTLFLDEVGELPAMAQVKLLRVLADRQVRRLGATAARDVDFRLVAATHRDLSAQVQTGTFREDLLYRLKVFPVELPPLRKRAKDLPLIVEFLIEKLAARLGVAANHAAPDLMPALCAHTWPGNVRELRNVLERALVIEDGPELSAASLPVELLRVAGKIAAAAPPPAADNEQPGEGPLRPFAEELKAFELAYFRRLRSTVGTNISRMARVSGVGRPTLYRKLEELGQVSTDGQADRKEE